MTAADPVRQGSSRLPDLTRFLPKTGFSLFLFLTGWLALHAGIRLTLTDVIGVDDVEQQIFGQVLAMGYHPKQPPLYTWLLYATERVTGPGLLAIVLVKYAHLAAFFVTYWALCQRLLVSTAHRVATMLGLLLVFQYAWQVHAGFTHSLTLLVTTSLVFLQFLRLVDRPSMGNYILFGLLCGLGILSKYNFLMALAALIVAAATIPVCRKVILKRKFLLSLVACLAVIAGPLLWLLDNSFILATSTDEAGHSLNAALQARGKGLGALAGTIAGYLSPLLIVLAWPILRGRPAGHATGKESHRLTGRFLLAGVFIMIAVILVMGLEAMKARWLHPLLFIAPVWMMRRIERSDGAWTETARRLFAMAVILFGLLVPVMRITEYYVGPPFCKHCRPTWPQSALAAELWQKAPAPVGLAFTLDDHLAGNLRSRLPDLKVLTPHYPFFNPFKDQLLPVSGANANQAINCVAIWRRDKGGDTLPGTLKNFMDNAGVKTDIPFTYQDITLPNPVITDRQHVWRWTWLPGCLADQSNRNT